MKVPVGGMGVDLAAFDLFCFVRVALRAPYIHACVVETFHGGRDGAGLVA